MKGPRWFDGNMRIANLPDAGSLPAGSTNANHTEKGDFTMKLSDWITIIGAIATIVITVAESSQENKINNL